MTQTTPQTGRRRDVRVDRIGFVQELVKHWIEADIHGDKSKGIKGLVKANLTAGETVEADFFEASLIEATDTTLSAALLLRLYDQKAITRAEMVEMLAVKVEPARKILPPKTLARLTIKSPGTPRLVVSRKPGVELTLQQAVAAVSCELLGYPKQAA
jgi:hypothetical protein